LQSGAALKSLQFLVEINRDSVATPPITNISLQALTPNDLVLLPGPAPGNTPVGFQTFYYEVSSNGLEVIITAGGSSSGLDMASSGVAVLLAVQIPTNAGHGQSYTLDVLYPAGNDEGVEAAVPLNEMGPQSLTISSP